MKRHFVTFENKCDLKAYRNECLLPSITRQILNGIDFDPMDLCQYESAAHTIQILAHKLHTHSENISVNNGSECVIRSTIESLSDYPFVITSPTFEMTDFYMHYYNIEHEEIPFKYDEESGFSISFDHIKDKYKKVLYIVSPHNPTGVEFDIYHLCSQFKYVVIDQAYMNPIKPLRFMYNLITIRSFSKMAALTGQRFGFAHSLNTNLIDNINQTRPMYLPSLTLKMVNYIIENDIPSQVETRMRELAKKPKARFGKDCIQTIGNFALLRNHPIVDGYKLREYTIDGNIFYRMTLHE